MKSTHLKLILFYLFLLVSFCGYAQKERSFKSIQDSLFQQLHLSSTAKDSVDIFNKLSYSFRRTNAEQVLEYAQKAEQLATAIAYKKGRMLALKHIGIGYHKMGASADAVIHYCKEASTIAKEIGDYYTQAACYNNIALVYRERGQYSAALKQYNNGIKVFEKHAEKDNWLNVLLLSNTGSAYIEFANYKQGQVYIDRAIQYAKKNNYTDILSQAWNELALIKTKQQDWVAAKEVLQEAIKLQTAIGDINSLIESHNRLGDVAIEENNFTLAQKYYEQAYQSSNENHFLLQEIWALKGLSIVQQTKGNIEEALKYAELAKQRAEKAESIRNKAEVLIPLAKLYAQQDNYKAAYLAKKEYTTIQDSINQLDKKMYAMGLEENFQNENELEQQKFIQKVAFAVGGLIALLLSIFIWSQNRNNRNLRLANQKAKTAAEAKQNFLSSMSHEIRTPMNAVIGFADILLSEKPREDQLPYLDNLRTSSHYLMDLLNDVLDFSKLEADKVSIEKIPFELEKHLSSIIEVFKISNQNQNLAIRFTYDVPIKHKLLGDPTRLKQILANLIGNAIKFTPNGYVHLSVKSLHQAHKETIIHFELEDTGIGVSKDKQKLIFESFSQASSTTTRQFGGSGLGLAITKRLVELQGGQIQLKSTEGKGSTFSFQLEYPITDDPLDAKHIANSVFHATGQLKNTKILLAEDNVFNQKVAIKILERYGAVTTLATNGQEALEAVQEQDFDIILMDLHMPVMDGFEAIRHIRDLEGKKSTVPIIALTAASVEELGKYPLLSNIHYVSKPFKAEQLILTVLQQLPIAQKMAKKERTNL